MCFYLLSLKKSGHSTDWAKIRTESFRCCLPKKWHQQIYQSIFCFLWIQVCKCPWQESWSLLDVEDIVTPMQSGLSGAHFPWSPEICMKIYFCSLPYTRFFLKVLFIFRQRGREGEREEEKHQCVVASWASTTGDLAHNPSMFPDSELNQWPFGSQAITQSTEPGLLHQF